MLSSEGREAVSGEPECDIARVREEVVVEFPSVKYNMCVKEMLIVGNIEDIGYHIWSCSRRWS